MTITYKDYARGGRVARMTLSADEFLRRFFQRVLPRGFVRIRGFGLLANSVRQGNLSRCRELLGGTGGTDAGTPASEPVEDGEPLETLPCCKHCGQATLRLIGIVRRPTVPELVERTYPRPLLDSS